MATDKNSNEYKLIHEFANHWPSTQFNPRVRRGQCDAQFAGGSLNPGRALSTDRLPPTMNADWIKSQDTTRFTPMTAQGYTGHGIQFKVQERLSPCDRSHSNQNANWVRSCRQTEKIVRIAVAGGAVVWGRSTQTTLGSAPFVYIARSLVPYSNIFGLGLGLWASTTGICWVGFPVTSDATRWSLAHGRTWMTKRAMLACIFNEGRMYTELTGAALVYTTRCRPHPKQRETH